MIAVGGLSGRQVEFLLWVLCFPSCTADDAAHPFGTCSGRIVGFGLGVFIQLNFIPQNEGVIPLDPDARVDTNLGLQESRRSSSLLSRGRGAFLEKIEGVER